jgi:hypothetical protein
VPLETLVFSFDSGATAEEIAQQYPSLRLADVYAVIAYVLENPDSVRAYVAVRAAATAALRAEVEGSQPSAGIRARLLARRSQAAPE